MTIESTKFIEVDGLKIRYLRGGSGGGVPIVMSGPWPESLFAGRRIWPRLGASAEVIAFDLPGFGLSEGRDDLMTPQAMGRFLPKILTALGLPRVHAVGPDVGTSAFLFAAVAEPQRFESLVVGSGGLDESRVSGGLKDLIEAPSLQAYEHMKGEDFAATAIDRMMKRKPEPAVLDDYKRASADGRFLRAMAYVRAYPRDLPKLRALLPSVRTPVLGIWGAHDPLVEPANADVLGSTLKRTRSVVIDAGHFVWEDAPDAYADAVSAWIEGGYRSV